MARGVFEGLFIDGARLASPGLVSQAMCALGMQSRVVAATIGFHLGPEVQMRSIHQGYDQREEDRLLAKIRWEEDGYRLFTVAALAESSAKGWFQPLAESNALFMNRSMWSELTGVEERFVSPGGGAVNLDTYVRVCTRMRAARK